MGQFFDRCVLPKVFNFMRLGMKEVSGDLVGGKNANTTVGGVDPWINFEREVGKSFCPMEIF